MTVPNSEGYDLLLCGGGVIGLSIAWQASRDGMRVAIVDAAEFGSGSSWAGAGILPAGATVHALDPLEQLRSLSHRLHAEWSAELFMATGIDNEYRRCGGLYMARTQAERATLAANRMWWTEHGIEYQAWDASNASEQHAALKFLYNDAANVEAWFIPDDCRVRNPRHIRALVEACKLQNVAMFEQESIQSFVTRDDRIVGAITNRRTIEADHYCITNGAWASQLLDGIHVSTGILPVRGQMLLYRLPQALFPMVINDGHRYLVPRDDGLVLAGSCEEEVGFKNETTEEMINELREWAVQLFPPLKDATLERAWSGLRPGSFDGFPYLGQIQGYRNAYLAAGHFRHGLHWSTGTAVLMTQLMQGQKSEIDLAPFRLIRGRSS